MGLPAFDPPYTMFRFHGWRNGIMVMRHKDGTLYSFLTRLEWVESVQVKWYAWSAEYPQTTIYSSGGID